MPTSDDTAGREAQQFTVIVRVRLAKLFASDAASAQFTFQGRPAIVKPASGGKALSETEVVRMEVAGFADAHEAWGFAERLLTALNAASVHRSHGTEVLRNRNGGGPTPFLRARMKEELGVDVVSDQDGVVVTPDPGRLVALGFSANAQVLTPVNPFLETLSHLGNHLDGLSARTRDALEMLNAALMHHGGPIPVAVLSVSAVERLIVDVNWSDGQRAAVSTLARQAEFEESLPEPERSEIAEAIRRLSRRSQRAGMRDLCHRLGLTDLWPAWDDVYHMRSRLFHGSTIGTPDQFQELAQRAQPLASRIVLAAASAEGLPNSGAVE